MLYNYFKARFKSKLNAFGRKRLELEKKRLKHVADNKLRRCKGKNIKEMCKYYHKPEIAFIEELKSIQNEKSLQLLNTMKHKNTDKKQNSNLL